MQQNFSEFQERLHYRFINLDYLSEAFRHSSYVNESPDGDIRDNERLEFLGDAVLNLIVGHLLMVKHPHLREGDLSRMRAKLVNEQELAAIARGLHLGECLQLGKGEALTNGQEKPSILANALEAVTAAIYLDGGFAAAFEVLSALFLTHLTSVSDATVLLDYKSRLQEFIQLKKRITPQYRLIDETGPDHDKTFRTQISIGDIVAVGEGKSKKAAEQEAAKNILKLLEKA
jgi:ribonuclease III